MNSFTRHVGRAAPLMRPNIDTDVIAPLNRSSSSGEPGALVFESLRYNDDGSLNDQFVLNRPEYEGASVLLTGRNFGTGSSRESAVTGLLAIGIRCVIASSYGEIFYNNCFANGLLPVVLSEEQVDALALAVTNNPSAELVVDLESTSVKHPDFPGVISFNVGERLKKKMLLGLDDLSEILAHEDEFSAYQARDRGVRPWVYDW